MKFQDLPQYIQQEVKDCLTCYPRTSVFRNIYTGEYSESNVAILHNGEYVDAFIAEFTADDIYTKAEQTLNYAQQFRDFPFEYKGIRDYSLISDSSIEITLDDNNNIVAA